MKAPIFALIDCNNFYCSCERIFNPKLIGKPIVVLSNNDGCIVARSQEAKDLGVPMAAPYYKYQDFLRANNVYVFSSNYQLYGDISRRVTETIKTFAEEIELYSIDEAFVTFEGLSHSELIEVITKIRNTIKKWTGIPVSIGIGPTKTLAKVANHIAKKHTETGIFNICSPESQAAILETFPVQDLWGVGRKWKEKLWNASINTASQLRDTSCTWMRKYFTVVGERLVLELNGVSCLKLEDLEPRKSIMSSKSFGKTIKDKQNLSEALANYAAHAVVKLRGQKSKTKAMYVFIRTNRFRPQAQQHYNSCVYEFSHPTADTTTVINGVLSCLNKLYLTGYDYNKAGVILFDLVSENDTQHTLFALKDAPKKMSLMHAIDKVNYRRGRNTLFFAAQGIERKWAMNCDNRSPRYTTNWREIPTIK